MSGGFRISPPITFFDGHVSSFGRRASLYPRIKNLPVDLIISGHLHGGIIRLLFIGGIIGDEEKRILPDYTSGVYKEGDDAAEMIVSRGCDNRDDRKGDFKSVCGVCRLCGCIGGDSACAEQPDIY